METATTAQITYIQTLQAQATPVTLTREEWAAHPGNAYTVECLVRDERTKYRTGEHTYVADQIAAIRAAEDASDEIDAAYPERTNPEHKARRKEGNLAIAAAEEALRLAVEDHYWAEVQEADAARTIDPTTLSKAEASRIIDLLK